MKPKIAEEVPTEDRELFLQVREIVEGLPDLLESPAYIWGTWVSKDVAISHFKPDCHTFTRALAEFLPVDVHDGLIVEQRGGELKRHWHSWLTRRGTDGRFIIDPWPLGVVSGPALFIQDYAFHFGPEMTPPHVAGQQFKRHLAITRYEMRKVIRSKKQVLRAAA